MITIESIILTIILALLVYDFGQSLIMSRKHREFQEWAAKDGKYSLLFTEALFNNDIESAIMYKEDLKKNYMRWKDKI